jgi:hypothetical protein
MTFMHRALAILLLASPAVAQPTPQPAPARTIDMTVPINDAKGYPLKDPADVTPDDKACDKCAPLTLGHAIAHALNGSYDDERGLGWEQRYGRGALALRVQDQKEATLTAPETAVIERLLGKLWGPSVIVQAIPLLDPNMKPPEVQ